MFDRIGKKLGLIEEKKDFLNVLTETAREDMGIGSSDSGLSVEEEEMIVDPDSIPAGVLEKICSKVDDMVDDDMIESEISELLEETNFEEEEIE